MLMNNVTIFFKKRQTDFSFRMSLKFFGAVHFDVHFELLRDDPLVWYFMLCNTSRGKAPKTNLIEFTSSQQHLDECYKYTGK